MDRPRTDGTGAMRSAGPAADEVLHVRVPADRAELAAGELWAAGCTAVRELDDGSTVVLEASFPTAAATRAAAAGLGATYDVWTVAVDASWRDEWRRHAVAVDAGPRVRVVPAWRAGPVPAGHMVLPIDPGSCFGSGSHATTRTLLEELDRLVTPGQSVLDVGTGSGILAVAAARLGASPVIAIDIDPATVAVVRANAEANGVGDSVDASTVALADVTGPFDLVVANLSALTLVDLAADLVRVTAPGGRLLVSGMLDGQWTHVAPSFAGLVLDAVRSVDGWTTAILRRH